MLTLAYKHKKIMHLVRNQSTGHTFALRRITKVITIHPDRNMYNV